MSSAIDLTIAETILATTNTHTSPARHAAAHPGEEMARARATVARGKLEDYIATSAARGRYAAERVFSEVPTDAIAPANRLEFAPLAAGSMGVTLNGEPTRLHRHALQQTASRLGIPFRYLADMANSTDEWRQMFAAATLNEHAVHSTDRYLVRSAGGQVRGVLSDAYRRLDSRPMLEAFLAESERAGLVVADGIANDVRVSVKVIKPEVVELTPGDFGVLGLEWANSDYGAGKHVIGEFVVRLLCLNGMTGQSLFGAVHLGRRISDSAAVSQRTVDLDTATMTSAIRDVVADYTKDGGRAATQLKRIADAAGAQVKGDPLKGRLLTSLSSVEQRRARELFDGPEVVMLPAEPTRWRLSQTISWMANEEADGLRKLELERMAGEILERTTAAKEATASESSFAGGLGA
jgi:hypothetical protein